ncbi:hypothetical protein EJ08DRAFT_731605 [Tothia fuscella]|uniref:DUF6590 domain-containing protein n=1 Tax=Tothia fuscella TaxID=1048955 RepID=A0A9P4NXU7_9PEZI|nr:hypothetical protein EJ08DRAFT_731605 [Tothia fuscella]
MNPSASLETAWSSWAWDENKQSHYCYRLNASGVAEYHYQQSQAQSSTPRTTTAGDLNAITEGLSQTTLGDSRTTHSVPQTSAYTQNAALYYNQRNQIAAPTNAQGGYQQLDASSQVSHYTLARQSSNVTSNQSTSSAAAQETTATLEKSYKVIPSKNIKRFFVPGQVFAMMWIEPAGKVPASTTSGATKGFWIVQHEQYAYCEIRRFIIVNTSGHHSLCIPIQSYSGRGAVGRYDVEHHSIVYTSTSGKAHAPSSLPGENIVKEPIEISPSGSETLSTTSRVNFSKTYTVDHHAKVKKIGTVTNDSMAFVRVYWREASGQGSTNDDDEDDEEEANDND